MQTLLNELHLPFFEQYSRGDVLSQTSRGGSPQQSPGANAKLYYRVKGGMIALIHALQNTLDPMSLRLSCLVKKLCKQGGGWLLGNDDEQFNAKHVVFAVPPRVLLAHLPLADYLSRECVASLLQALAWMAAQAKFIAYYKKAFWREAVLSGDVFSRAGPLVEIHDACSQSRAVEPCALFGFVGISAQQLRRVSHDEFERYCLQQLVAIFGEQAVNSQAMALKDWAQDEWVCADEDISESPRHPAINLQRYRTELELQNISFVGSEYAEAESGYLEGALISVNDYFKAPRINYRHRDKC
ncbi:MAG: monoamine oxidase [Granulosicoccus sp.]|jgi:monoamine oxidase